MASLIDIDDPRSWPGEVAEVVANAVERLGEDGWREYPYDHIGWWNFESEERELRAQLADHRLVGYHATRLLPHELSDISTTTGLEVLTDALRLRKVSDARDHFPDAFEGDDPNGAVLLRSGPNDWQGTAGVRLGALDFAAPFMVFHHAARGFINLLDTWGGETLGWLADGRGSSMLLMRLTALSEPAIVEFGARVATLNLTPLLPAFAGRLDEVPGSYWHQWRTEESIPPEFVLEVITTGSARWPDSLAEYRS